MNVMILQPGPTAEKEAENKVEDWYGTSSQYQYPGGNTAFDSCNVNISISEYGPFTQVVYLVYIW